MADRIDPEPSPVKDLPADPPAAALELARVLLVDNADVSRFRRASDLKQAGAIVDFADDTEGALDALGRSMADGEPYDLIILDLEAFGRKGYTVAERLRAAQYLGPILALTDKSPRHADGRAVDAGCDELLKKPVATCVLLDASGGLVGRERERRYTLAKPDQVTSELATYPELMMMLRRFVSHLPEQIESLIAAQREQDLKRLRDELDLIKRNATSHGYPTIRASAVNAQLELEQARKADADSVLDAIDDLVDLCRRATFCPGSPPPPSGGPILPPSG